MRLRSVIFIVLIIHVLNAYGQRAELAFEAGFFSSTWELAWHESQYESKFRIGILAGANNDIPVVPKMAMHSGLQYATFGTIKSVGKQRTAYSASYLMLPVAARYDLDNGLSFMAGPQFGRLIRAKESTSRGVRSVSGDMSHIDLFAVIGVQHRSQHGISIGLWYQHGLMDSEIGTHTSLQNRGFGLELSYKPCGGVGDIIRKLFKEGR